MRWGDRCDGTGQLQMVQDLPDPGEQQLNLTALFGREAFTVDLSANDREGLLLDVTTFLKDSGVSLLSNSGSVDPATGLARIVLELRLASLVELAVVIDGLRQIPGVIAVRRVEHQHARQTKLMDGLDSPSV